MSHFPGACSSEYGQVSPFPSWGQRPQRKMRSGESRGNQEIHPRAKRNHEVISSTRSPTYPSTTTSHPDPLSTNTV